MRPERQWENILCFHGYNIYHGRTSVRVRAYVHGVDAPGQIRGDTVWFKEAVNYQKIEDCRWHGLMPRVKPKEPILRCVGRGRYLRVIIFQTFEPINRASIDLSALDMVKKKRMEKRQTFDRSKFIFIAVFL